MTYYTLVRHTGYSQTEHWEFEHAVETRAITDREADTVRRHGGIVFGDYANASTAEETTNYPPNVVGLVPRCEGTFLSHVLPEEIYVPPAKEK